MVQKTQTLFIDDLDGSDAEGTVASGLDGTGYEIDLNAEHTRTGQKSSCDSSASTDAVGSPFGSR